MKFFNSFLIFCLFIYSVKSQLLNLKLTEDILRRSNAKLRASQSTLASSIFSFTELAKNLSNLAVAADQKNDKTIALIELADLAEDLQTISNHDTFKLSSTNCDNINYRIINIETNLRQYEAFDEQAMTNRTLLQDHMSKFWFNERVGKIIINVTMLRNQVSIVDANYYEYCKTLLESIYSELTAKTNLEYYKYGKCDCLDEEGIDNSSQISDIIKFVSDANISFETIESTITIAINQIYKSYIYISPYDSYNLDQLKSNLRKVLYQSDLIINFTSPSSCHDLLDIVGRAQFKAWFVVENEIVVRSNSMIIEKNLILLNQTLTSSTNLTSSQKRDLNSVILSTLPVLVAFQKHLSDSHNLNLELLTAASELRKLSDNFCLCRSSQFTTFKLSCCSFQTSTVPLILTTTTVAPST